MNDNQQQVQLWDNMAPHYDADLVRKLLMQRFVTFALQVANIQQQNVTVLDIGTGTGAIVQQVILLPQVTQIIATDISSKMLDELQNKNLPHAASKLQTMVLDAQELTSKIAANSIDFVFSQFVHMFVTDKSKAFQELYQVLKPNGGKAIITVIKDNSIANLGMTILLQVLPEWQQQLPGFFHLALSFSNASESQQLIMQAAPFASCACHTAHFGDTITFEQFLQMNAGLLQRVAAMYPAHVVEAWHKVAQEYNKNGTVEITLTANVFEIVK